MLAQILEGDIELVAHLVTHDPADADPAWIGQRFEPRRDIDAVAVDVVLVDDDIADVDPDAKLNALLGRDCHVARHHLALQLDGAPHRIDDARKFDKQPVASFTDDAPAVLLDFGIA